MNSPVSHFAPVPRPPAAHASDVAKDGIVVDVVSSVVSYSYAWTLRSVPDGIVRSRSGQRFRSAIIGAQIASEVLETLGPIRGDRPVLLRCHSAILRDHMLQMPLPPGMTVAEGLSLSPGRNWAVDQQLRHSEILQTLEETLHRSRVLYAASDGSVHRRISGAAWAWVDMLGNFAIGRSPSSNVTMTELGGALAFTAQMRWDTFGKAVLFMDSLRAIEALRAGSYSLLSRFPETIVEDALYRIRSGQLEILWVRGHQDHVLNDLADRLAVLGRRSLNDGEAVSTRLPLARSIVDGEKEKLATQQWPKVRSKAIQEARAAKITV